MKKSPALGGANSVPPRRGVLDYGLVVLSNAVGA
jgi:hypothetical protein